MTKLLSPLAQFSSLLIYNNMKYKRLLNIPLLLVILSSCSSENESDTESVINQNKNKILSEKKEKALFGWRCAHLAHKLLLVMDSQGAISEYIVDSMTSPKIKPKYSGDKIASGLYLHWAWQVRTYGMKLAVDNDPNFDMNDTEYKNQIDSVDEMIVNREPWVTNDFLNCRDTWSMDEHGIDLSTQK